MSNINQDKKYHFIYKTTNLLNGKFYYGMHSTSNLKDGYIGSGKRLKYSINKYGIENFKCEILEFLSDRESLKYKEKELINLELLNNPLCMNLKLGGEGGWPEKYKHDPMLQFKRSSAGGKAAAKSGKNQAKVKWLTENDPVWVAKRFDTLSNAKKNHPNWFFSHSEESKKQIGKTNSLKQLGDKNSQYGTCWIHNNTTSIKIKKSEIEQYLLNDWILGRKIKFEIT